MKLTIVVPAYHEADRITQSLQDLSAADTHINHFDELTDARLLSLAA